MASKNVIIALLALCGIAYGQTRSLLVDTSGIVQYTNTVEWQGALSFGTNAAAQATTRSNLSLGLPALTNSTGADLLSAIGGLTTNGSAVGLTNFPQIVLQTNSADAFFPQFLLRTNGSAAALSNFPASVLLTNSSISVFPQGLLRTNGDGSALTNLPNANLNTAIGTLPLNNGGSGATNAETARTNFGLPWSGLTNVDAAGFRTALLLGTSATNDASAFQPASANLTNLANNNGGSLTNVSVDLTTVLPSYSGNDGKVLAVATGGTNVEWTAISNTVTDASTLTNFPASILQTNSSESVFPQALLRTNGSAAGLTNFPTLNQNTTGTASNVTGVVAIVNGGSGQTTAAAAIEAFLPSYSGNANRILALNSNANGLVWTTNSGGGGGLPETPLAISNGGTAATTAAAALTNLTLLRSNNVTVLGQNTTASAGGVAIGNEADANGTNSIAIRGNASGTNAISIGDTSGATQKYAIAIGNNAQSLGSEGISIGRDSSVLSGSTNSIAIGYDAQSAQSNSIAIGYLSRALTNSGVAIGAAAEAASSDSVGIGTQADISAAATNSVQLGRGTNSTANSIQFRSAGTVDTNEWSRIAELSTYPTTNIQVTVVGGATNTLVFSNGILTSVTSP